MKSNLLAVRKEYDRDASKYDRRWTSYCNATFAAAEKLCSAGKGSQVLDIAGGTGSFAQRLVPKIGGGRIVVADLSPEMISIAKKKFTHNKKVSVSQEDVHRLSFEDGAFSHVVSISGLHYCWNVEKALDEISRILQDGGEFVLVDWCNDSWYFRLYDYWMRMCNEAHARVYTIAQMERLLSFSGFEVEKSKHFRCGMWSLMAIKAQKKS